MNLIKESQDYQRGGTQKDVYAAADVTEVACPLCGSLDRATIYREHGALVVSQCRACSLIYTSTRVLAPEQVYWGSVDTYYEEARLVFEGKAPHHRDPNYLEELQLIKRYKPGGRFLDVGCNMGMLLRHVRRLGWTGVGVEPSPTLSSLAINRFGLDVHNCFLHELPEALQHSFDVVALSDVFEHITEPIAFLAQVARYLAPDGIVYIKVPNANWNLFKQKALALLGRAPAQGVWDSYEHVVHYTDRTLAKMLDRAGFDLVTMTIGTPIQVPVWHQYVGHYYLYPSPPSLDWKRYLGRAGFYWLSWPERLCRLGAIGWFAPNVVAIARRRSEAAVPGVAVR
jgi:2-polyprenyl-3-methyl-5-hydroxy-6-metoxy-1,4-benzoquinol methylase